MPAELSVTSHLPVDELAEHLNLSWPVTTRTGCSAAGLRISQMRHVPLASTTDRVPSSLRLIATGRVICAGHAIGAREQASRKA